MKSSLFVLFVALASCPGPDLEVPPPVGPISGVTTTEPEVTATTNEPIDLGTGIQEKTEETASEKGSETLRAAIRRSLPFLEEQGVAWMEGRVPIQEGAPCVSCHHVGFSLWSQKEARRAGVPGDKEVFETLSATATAFLNRPGKPRAFSSSSLLLAKPGTLEAPSEEKAYEQVVNDLLEIQTESGAWEARGQFPTQRRSVGESNAVATLWSLLALEPEKGRASVLDAQAKAVAWLDQDELSQKREEKSTEWLAARIIVADALEASKRADELRLELLQRQNEDGGWGWLASDSSEAFSTGQALYALSIESSEAIASPEGLSSEDGRPLDQAVSYLLQSQNEDGTWTVASSAISSEPSEAKDVIYHFWGTAWAAIGLSRASSQLLDT